MSVDFDVKGQQGNALLVYLWIILIIFISCLDWRHPFTAESPLVTQAKFLQICSYLETTYLHLDSLRVSKFSKFSFLGERLFIDFLIAKKKN